MKHDGHLTLAAVDGTSLRFRAEVGGHVFDLDSGDDVVPPSPVDVVLAAVGGCTGMDVISILRKKRQVVTSYRIELNGTRRDEHPRAFTAIELVHRVRGRGVSRDAVAEAVRLSETKYCSVHAMLAPAVTLTSRIEVEEETAG